MQTPPLPQLQATAMPYLQPFTCRFKFGHVIIVTTKEERSFALFFSKMEENSVYLRAELKSSSKTPKCRCRTMRQVHTISAHKQQQRIKVRAVGVEMRYPWTSTSFSPVSWCCRCNAPTPATLSCRMAASMGATCALLLTARGKHSRLLAFQHCFLVCSCQAQLQHVEMTAINIITICKQ